MTISSANQIIKTSTVRNDVAACLGEIVEICARDPYRRNIDVKSLLYWIKPAILHDQILLLKSEGEIYFSGYLTWAFVSDCTLEKYLNQSRFYLHPSEWNEGLNLIVVDFCLSGKLARTIKSLMSIASRLHCVGIKSITICVRDNLGNPQKIHALYRDKN